MRTVARPRPGDRVTIAALALLAAAAPVAAGTFTAELRHRAFRHWTAEVPQETWFAVSGGIAVPHAGGDRFAAGLEGTDLRLDTDGDGELDRTIRATPDQYGERHARVVLHGHRDDGGTFTYGVRLRERGAGWQWAPGGAMVGTLETPAGSARLTLIDRNGNGRYDDVGADAMILGGGDAASFLSSTVHVGDRLYALRIDPAGETARLEPYDGPTARLDLAGGFSASARLLSAIVRSADGAHSFDLAPYDGPIDVPAATYEIVTGQIGLGTQRVEVTAGRAEPIALEPADERTVEWGGPVTAEFKYFRDGDQVTFRPDAVWYYGAAGEQYDNWRPLGKSPVFTVRDKASEQVLEVLILPGSC